MNSSDKNVSKFIFTNEGEKGAVAEAVLYKYPTYEDRTVICCSTQSGCPVGCRFCGTGEFFIRSLTVEEIVWTEHKMGELSTPCMSLYPEDAQALMDTLFAAGVHPSKTFGESSQIEAIKYHLDDMRKLVFKEVVAI